jgi:formylmethanofuran dehydrogenase subunit A
MPGTMIIRNGYVFDPLNEIDGEIKDIFIKDGKIVEDLKGAGIRDAKVIDAKGKTVMPGGVDSHSHVAGAKVNGGRMMCPEDRYKWVTKKGEITHSGSGNTVPSVYIQGYDYAKMGYTTVFEAAMPPMEARHTHEEIRNTPILDMGAYMVLGNNWFIMRYPGCWETTRDSLEVTREVKVKCNMDVEWQKTKIDPQRNQSVYLAHAQFNSFGGTSWGDFESGAKGIVDYVNKTDHVVIDNGAVPFGPATVMTGDGPAIHHLYKLTGNKWSNKDVELRSSKRRSIHQIPPVDHMDYVKESKRCNSCRMSQVGAGQKQHWRHRPRDDTLRDSDPHKGKSCKDSGDSSQERTSRSRGGWRCYHIRF